MIKGIKKVGYIMTKIVAFFKKDVVFSIALLIAIVTVFIVPPSTDYFGYINTTVLIIMFSLMIAVGGMLEANLFSKIAIFLTSKFYSIRYIGLVIVFSTFFLGMWVTNDAVLLTLVPFTIILTKQTKQEKYTLIIVILQTFAANMGASLTPMGDPQNIYLYSYYNLGFGEFVLTMLPVTITSFVLIFITTYFLLPNEFVSPTMVMPKINRKHLGLYVLIFVVTVLAVLKVIPAWVAFVNTFFFTLIFFRHLFKKVDYFLLMTFVMFFIISGNISQMHIFDGFRENVMNSNIKVYFSSLLTSQILSNVPASVLLSSFTDKIYWKALLRGVNVGAMGSLIASLASLITFKFVTKAFPTQKKEYVQTYTLLSVIFITFISLIIYFF